MGQCLTLKYVKAWFGDPERPPTKTSHPYHGIDPQLPAVARNKDGGHRRITLLDVKTGSN